MTMTFTVGKLVFASVNEETFFGTLQYWNSIKDQQIFFFHYGFQHVYGGHKTMRQL